jgi:hypothetical protein
MTVIRPEITAAIWRLRELLITAVLASAGLWLVLLGGWVFMPLGAILLALAATLARSALARLRFQQAVGAPGIVELDEAQLGYLGPEVGGFISLNEAVELRLVTMRGRRLWRVKQADGQAMLVPVDATGAAQLFDAFAALPGMDISALAAAVSPAVPDTDSAKSTAPALPGPQMRVIWRRAARAGLAPR